MWRSTGNWRWKLSTPSAGLIPTALIVAPALSGFDPPYLRALGEMGLFNRLDAVTVHPYGVGAPEEAGPFYVDLARLLHRFSPSWQIPVLSGEWGYSSVDDGLSEGQQAQFLARQWLVNLAYDVNLSIWYDWRNDGADRTELEQNFGTLDHDLSLKPAYRAARTLLTTLDGYRYLRRIPLENPADYLLLFQKESQVAMALWTTGEARTLILPISVDDVRAVDMLGDVGVVESQGGGLVVEISQSPRYLMFRADQAASRLGGWWPYNSVQCFAPDADNGVRVVFSESPGPLFGDVASPCGRRGAWFGAGLRQADGGRARARARRPDGTARQRPGGVGVCSGGRGDDAVAESRDLAVRWGCGGKGGVGDVTLV